MNPLNTGGFIIYKTRGILIVLNIFLTKPNNHEKNLKSSEHCFFIIVDTI